ncbi:MAG: hypothetical protein DLM68_00230, partial [Hyphomicrobiales bacterium]
EYFSRCPEVYRVLAPGGRYLFNVWDSPRYNPFGRPGIWCWCRPDAPPGDHIFGAQTRVTATASLAPASRPTI